MELAAWVCGAIALISALVSLAYAVAGLRAAHADAVLPSRYALVRSLALAVVTAVALIVGSEPFVAAGALAMALVQAGDAFVGAAEKDTLKTWGPAFTALLGAASLVWMLVSGQ